MIEYINIKRYAVHSLVNMHVYEQVEDLMLS